MDRRGLFFVCFALAGLLHAPGVAQGVFWHPFIEAFAGWQQSPEPLEPPFTLDGEQERWIQNILDRWERADENVESFSACLTSWQYDLTFGPKENDYLMAEQQVTLKYRRPDCAMFRVDRHTEYDGAQNKYVTSQPKNDVRCDGKTYCFINRKTRSQEIFDVPEERRGNALRVSLLPFLFPVDSAGIRERYWFRETTPTTETGKQIWLEAWPKTKQDALTFHHAEIVLSLPDCRVLAVQLTHQNRKDRTVYHFDDIQRNEAAKVHGSDFQPPPLGAGWKRDHLSSAFRALRPH